MFNTLDQYWHGKTLEEKLRILDYTRTKLLLHEIRGLGERMNAMEQTAERLQLIGDELQALMKLAKEELRFVKGTNESIRCMAMRNGNQCHLHEGHSGSHTCDVDPDGHL